MRAALLCCVLGVLVLSASGRSLLRGEGRDGERREPERREPERREPGRPQHRGSFNGGGNFNGNGNNVHVNGGNRVNVGGVNPGWGTGWGWGGVGPTVVAPVVNPVTPVVVTGSNACGCATSCVAASLSRCARVCTPNGGTSCSNAFTDALGLVRMCC